MRNCFTYRSCKRSFYYVREMVLLTKGGKLFCLPSERNCFAYLGRKIFLLTIFLLIIWENSFCLPCERTFFAYYVRDIVLLTILWEKSFCLLDERETFLLEGNPFAYHLGKFILLTMWGNSLSVLFSPPSTKRWTRPSSSLGVVVVVVVVVVGGGIGWQYSWHPEQGYSEGLKLDLRLEYQL